MKYALLIGLVISAFGFAHEGHDTPGVLPIAPHGGKVAEAEGEKEPKKGESELFFEAVYNNKQLVLYPLMLAGEKMDSFVAVQPKKSIKDVSVSIVYPRSNKREELKTEIGEDSLKAVFDPKRAYRFIVNVSANHGGQVKVAKIQVERK